MHITNEITATPPFAMDKMNLNMINIENHGENDETKQATPWITIATLSGIFLPYLSAKAPNIINPSNVPAMKDI